MSLGRRIGGALVLAFILCGASTAGGVLLDRIVAVVNKEVITWSELYRAMEFKSNEEFKALSDSEKKKVFRENEAAFLETMIEAKLQLQDAKRLDIDASSEEINLSIENIKKKYSMGDKEFEESLQKEGFTFEEYKKLLAEQIILNKVVSHQVKNKIIITDRDVDEYMAKHKDAGYRIRQIFLKRLETDDDKEALAAKAQELYQRLMAGEDFSVLAREYSNDPSAKVGGDLGFVKKDLLGKEFLDVISGMKTGDVSRPFWTAGGLHIIKLDYREDTMSVAELREQARNKLFEMRFNEDYRNWVRGLRERAFVEIRL